MDAIFFAEKILALNIKRYEQSQTLTQASLHLHLEAAQVLAQKTQDASPSQSPDLLAHVNQLSPSESLNYYRFFCKNQYDQSVYDLACCFMQNENYMRCINLIESHEMVDSHLRFRILLAQAYIMSGQVAVAIGILNRKMDSGEESK